MKPCGAKWYWKLDGKERGGFPTPALAWASLRQTYGV